MQPIITSEVVVAYAQCPRKAYLLLFSPEQGTPHEYIRVLERHRRAHQAQYLDSLTRTHMDVHPYTLEHLRHASAVLINAWLQVDGLAAACDVLTRVAGPPMADTPRYAPTICVGTYSVSSEQKLAMLFVGYVLGRLQHMPPPAGHIIAMDGTSHAVKLDKGATHLLPLLESLQAWTTGAVPAPPPIILNKHCPLCPFQRACRAQAEQEDNLSLLDGITARVMRHYEKKGIFTVKQLSYLFKPRKYKKGSRQPPPVIHKVELQALAIRDKKIYLQEMPALTRQPVELFMDMEGVPDRGRYYLIGLLVCQADTMEHYAFWADTDHEEGHMWQQCMEKVQHYPEAPIYHYGSYELRAVVTLAKRYHTDAESMRKRLVNIHRCLYGKVYFPVHSHGLKAIGHFLGARWSAPQASGLQSLVWRHQWEHTQDETYRDLLVTYNREDCHVLKQLTDELSQIQQSADTLAAVDFADQRKHQTTETSEQIQRQFRAIRKFAQLDYDKKKINFRQAMVVKETKEQRVERNRNNAYKLQRKLIAIQRRATKSLQAPQRDTCPSCGNLCSALAHSESQRTIINIIPTRNGAKKVIANYSLEQEYCQVCKKVYTHGAPDALKANQFYGHGFKAWVIYQRVALRLPYNSIVESLQEQFHEKINVSSIPNFIRSLAGYYAETEKTMTARLLQSPFIHADETQISIKKTHWYIWVFTDGKRVIFRLTETREPTFVHDLLVNYQGILISDFYAGYDAVPCAQQKCWVHLIRDMNDDLREAPFDAELEAFVLSVKDLIIPIMECIQQYGLRQKHLQRFKPDVAQFYRNTVVNKYYRSDLALKYQKRFIRYRESLFTFLDHEAIPWHNNTAEGAIRPIAKQRDISMIFSAPVTHDYLVLLGIRQTCRLQGKSFFKFLFSGETDLEHFDARTRKR
jgi:predicted RecB family nuclease